MRCENKLFQIVINRPKMTLGGMLFFVTLIETIAVFGAGGELSGFLVCWGVTLLLFVVVISFYKVVKYLWSLHFGIRKYFLPKNIRKVSVVIPNYNYAGYLMERIESIVTQVYPIYELIILDDASTDESVKVIEEAIGNLRKRKPDLKIRFILNDKNSGNVFKQWKKCFDEAQGDFVWICEADDFCSRYFLSSVMRAFDDDKVVLSYAESCTVDKDGRKIAPDLRAWTDEFKSGHWNRNYINSGKKELEEFMCVNNTIPNVSGVVFRKIDAPIEKYLQEAQKFRLVGDWYFYAKYLLNGKIAYCSESLNCHRIQDKGVTLSTDKYKQFLEISEVQDSIARDIKLSENSKKRVQMYRQVVLDSFGMSEEELKLAKTPFDEILRKSKMSEGVLLSVIVCAYNVEDYVGACLNSIVEALPEKSEIIIVDDGSTDGTAEVIRNCQEKCSKMHYYYKKKGGLASAKNFGLSKAKGRYVIFMDADDKIKSDGYQVMLKKALESGADIVVCDMALVYDDRTINCHVYHENPGGLKGFLIDGLMASSNNKMVKRELYKKIEKYPEGKNNEDVAITPVLMAVSKNIQYIPSSFYEYYQREGSIQNSDFGEKRLAIFDTVKQADLAIQKILPKEAEDILGIMIGNQLIALLVYVICEIKDANERNKFIERFCEKYREFGVLNSIYIEKYCNRLGLPKLPQYIMESSPERVYKYIKNGERFANFLDYIGRAFGIKRLIKKRDLD